MGLVGNKLVKPISIGDVQSAIGYSLSSDLGKVCTANSINMWAKYAPIEYNKVGILTDAERASVNRGHGFNFATYTNILSLFNAAVSAGASCAWSRQKPSTWYRLWDFLNVEGNSGYNRVAEIPFRYSLAPRQAMLNSKITLGTGADGSLLAVPDFGFDDFPALKIDGTPLNAGMAWRASGAAEGTTPYCVTFSSLDTLQEMTINPSYFSQATYDVVFFFTDRSYTTPTDGAGQGIYYLIPYPLTTLQVVSGKPQIVATLTLDKEMDKLTLNITASASYSLYNVRMTHAYNGNDYSYAIGNISVSASSPYSTTINMASGDNWLDASQRYFHLYVTFNSTIYDYPIDMRGKESAEAEV